ncbi:MAG: hypothetical protein AB3N18_02805 [Allomuricauda sp.]
MKTTSETSNITLEEAGAHYASSRKNYDLDGGESHLAYYRDKYPEYYTILIDGTTT